MGTINEAGESVRKEARERRPENASNQATAAAGTALYYQKTVDLLEEKVVAFCDWNVMVRKQPVSRWVNVRKFVALSTLSTSISQPKHGSILRAIKQI